MIVFGDRGELEQVGSAFVGQDELAVCEGRRVVRPDARRCHSIRRARPAPFERTSDSRANAVAAGDAK
jgi:hypothetical protein